MSLENSTEMESLQSGKCGFLTESNTQPGRFGFLEETPQQKHRTGFYTETLKTSKPLLAAFVRHYCGYSCCQFCFVF